MKDGSAVAAGRTTVSAEDSPFSPTAAVRVEAVPAIVDFFKPILLGQTVDDIPELWRRMYHCGNFWCRVGLGVIVLNGVERGVGISAHDRLVQRRTCARPA